MFSKFLVKFDLEFDLKFEISDAKNLVKFWGRTFVPARKARNISGRIPGQISDQISEENFGNFVSNFAIFFSETSFSRRAALSIGYLFGIPVHESNLQHLAGFLPSIWHIVHRFFFFWGGWGGVSPSFGAFPNDKSTELIYPSLMGSVSWVPVIRFPNISGL